MRDTCVNDSRFRQLFVVKYSHLLYPESKELYTKHLQVIIKTCSDRHGFVDYRNVTRLASMVGEIIC